MKTKTFVEELRDAKKGGYAIGAFNIFSHLSARAVVRAAQALGHSVILQTSVPAVEYFGPEELGGMLRRIAETASVNVVVHLDHCRSVELAKACVDAGWDSVMFDGSRLPLEENVALTREVVRHAHAKGVSVEGELGKIGGVEDAIAVSDGDATRVGLDESLRYIAESGVDAFAPAIGTAHGMYKGKPNIDYALLERLKAATETPVVIHGGTGLGDETFRKLIAAGGAKINVSTAVKHAYINGAKQYFAEFPDAVDPVGFDRCLDARIAGAARDHMKVFRGDGAW